MAIPDLLAAVQKDVDQLQADLTLLGNALAGADLTALASQLNELAGNLTATATAATQQTSPPVQQPVS